MSLRAHSGGLVELTLLSPACMSPCYCRNHGGQGGTTECKPAGCRPAVGMGCVPGVDVRTGLGDGRTAPRGPRCDTCSQDEVTMNCALVGRAAAPPADAGGNGTGQATAGPAGVRAGEQPQPHARPWPRPVLGSLAAADANQPARSAARLSESASGRQLSPHASAALGRGPVSGVEDVLTASRGRDGGERGEGLGAKGGGAAFAHGDASIHPPPRPGSRSASGAQVSHGVLQCLYLSRPAPRPVWEAAHSAKAVRSAMAAPSYPMALVSSTIARAELNASRALGTWDVHIPMGVPAVMRSHVDRLVGGEGGVHVAYTWKLFGIMLTPFERTLFLDNDVYVLWPPFVHTLLEHTLEARK